MTDDILLPPPLLASILSLYFSLSISLSHSYASNSLKRPSSLRPSFPLSSAPFLVLFILLCLFLPLLVGARGLARLPSSSSSSSSSSSPSPLASQWMAFLALAAAFPSKGCLLHSRLPGPGSLPLTLAIFSDCNVDNVVVFVLPVSSSSVPVQRLGNLLV